MGLLLANAQKEARKGNLEAKAALKQVGTVFLHNREVSAQEAVYLLTGMHLKESSRKLVFIPTGENIVRMSRPISTIEETDREEDIWMLNIVDRYKNRPNDAVFNDMCMATFASDYRIVSNGQKCKTSIQLQNDCGFITKRTRSQAAVIDHMRPSKTKNPELYYRVMIELFVPYRTDLKPEACETFLLFYKNGRVEFSDGLIHSVRSLVKLNRGKFEVIKEDIEKLSEEVNCDEVLESGWAELCPEQESDRLECIAEIDQQQAQNPEEEEALPIPELAVHHEEISHIERQNNILSRQDGLALVRSLNEQQLAIFYKIRAWCLNKVAGGNPKPFHVFITGGAGTGKSHLIRAIQYEAMRLLAPMCQNPDSITVLATAPTGIAAYNLKAATIHTTFHIPPVIGLPYKDLRDEKLNSLRLKYSDLQILIIDEISMVGHILLIWIHFRLRQIKASGDSSPFGNVCIVAVGDFYQLPPIKSKALYKDFDKGENFWSYFSFVELTTIMRQKDEEFAQLLNRLRTRSRTLPISNADIQLLRSRETGEESDALHIFARNTQVNTYNLHRLIQSCPDFVTLNAQDYGLNKKTGKLEKRTTPLRDTKYTCLPEDVSLGIGARVMLIKNIDLNDGLVNGICGTVSDIVWAGREFPVAIYVLFDDSVPGSQRRRRYRHPSPDLAGCTRIEPEEDRANDQGGIRRQFPLTLAWACTVHKVQGLSVDSAVVSLSPIDFAGQAYVSLSRVRTLSGLIIQDFTEKSIYCNDDVKFALHYMPPFMTESICRPISSERLFVLFLINTQGLRRHVTDLTRCTQLWQPNCIAVTETWLSADSCLDTVQIDRFVFHSRSRSDSYDCSTNAALVELCGQQHGGVGLYCDVNGAYDVTVPHVDLECLAYHNLDFNIFVVVIYRPPSYAMSLLIKNLNRLFDWLQSKSETIAIVGDFNEDILKSSKLSKFMLDRGYIQYVESPTTQRGTLIDHVYIKTTQFEVQSVVVPAYFSDHEGIACSFKYLTD